MVYTGTSTVRKQGGTHQIYEQIVSFLLGPTLKPPGELLDPSATWVVPY